MLTLICNTDHSATAGSAGERVLGKFETYADAFEALDFYESRYPGCDMEIMEKP